jgi:hypothetical protein
MTDQPALYLVPVRSRAAREFVALHHRHHRPPAGQVFAVGVATAGELVGVLIAGRPVARHLDDGVTLEVTRSCVAPDARNANSKLYAAGWRAAQALGYRRLVTYTQAGESGASLRGAGWVVVRERPARAGWDTPARRRLPAAGVDRVARTLWEAPNG